MLNILNFFSIISLCFVCSSADNSDVELFYTRIAIDGVVGVVKGIPWDDMWVAMGSYEDKVNVTGFGILEIETNSRWNSELQAYHAGILEGFLTSDLIYGRWVNVVDVFFNKQSSVDRDLIMNFLRSNTKWVFKQMKKKKNKNDAYWFQVKLFYLQMDGLFRGYNAKTKFKKLVWDDILLLNMIEELGDVLSIIGLPKSPYLGGDHCSALVKIMPDNSDIYFGHSTWNRYGDMLRIMKKYNLPYHTSASDPTTIPGHKISMPSYPGALLSVDDFYLIGSGLAVMETTIPAFNKMLFSQLQPEGIVWEGIRTMTANRLSSDGPSWHGTFKKYNSGTYNNQWMVLNYNLFHPGQDLGAGVLWVGEQLPGNYTAEDVTGILVSKGYWSSYNIPYFEDVYIMMGYEEEAKKHGTWFSYTEAPRSKIFARDHGNVTDMQSFMALMRSNDFKNDPFAFCNNCTPPYSAAGAIAARKDLNPEDGTGMQDHAAFGATDAKITNYLLFNDLEFIVVAGPTQGTNDQFPVFQWSQSPYASTVPHILQPDVYNFTHVTIQWDLRNSVPQVLSKTVGIELQVPEKLFFV